MIVVNESRLTLLRLDFLTSHRTSVDDDAVDSFGMRMVFMDDGSSTRLIKMEGADIVAHVIVEVFTSVTTEDATVLAPGQLKAVRCTTQHHSAM